MFRRLTLALFVAISLGRAAPGPAPNPPPVTFDTAPAPSWVMAAKPDLAAKDSDEGGISYLLIDRQDNVALQSFFYHEVRRVTSENGVQNGASVTATFDPSYQKLIFHTLHIVRGGARLNRLVRGEIKLLQREKDMESFLYDGAYTAHCDLEDVRVGDIIEYSFTVQGAHPVKGGRYSKLLYTDWGFPIHRVVTRFVYPEKQKLHFLTKNRPLKPVITSAKGTTEWLTIESAVPARRTDDDVPVDYDPNGWVEVSEYESWQEVAEWALPLFQPETVLSAELELEVEKLRKIADPEQRVLAAFHLVQDQVRYLGIESGAGSHRPTAPSEVFRRRFGDCKDKALLLVSVLRRCEIEATPALVSTSYRGTLGEHLPSPDVFNHAIVNVGIGDRSYWLDPTRSSAPGPLSQIYARDLKLALLLQPGTKALTSYSPPPESLPRRKITENYRIPAPGGTGELEVVTESYGLSAERTRSRFRESGREKIEKEYLQYYTRFFPKAVVKKPLVYEEIAGANACRTREHYSIPEIWTLNEESKKYELTLNPGDVAEAIGWAGPSQRDDPLALNYPAHVTQVINAKMFDQWTLNSKDQKTANAFFRFTDQAKVTGKNITLTYVYEALADRVEPKDLPGFNATVLRLRDNLGYVLYYQKPGDAFQLPKSFHQFNWILAAVTVVTAVALLALCLVLFFVTKRAVPLPPADTLPHHTGLGGWLVLVAIHQLVRPVRFVMVLVTLFPLMFNQETWRSLTQPGGATYHPVWKTALLVEFSGNLICLFWSLLLLLLFFRKRAVWPRFYAAFLLFVLVFVAFDFWLAGRLPVGTELQRENMRDVIQVVIAAAVWIPYCFVSKRVRATFCR